MNALIIEDEYPAAERLEKLIRKTEPTAHIVGVLDSVERACDWFGSHAAPDLIFSDIQLSDGLSFEIFAQCVVKSPIIFVTSYDEYAIQAFKVTSIDYLLKPIKQQELAKAIEKYKTFKHTFSANDNAIRLDAFLDKLPLQGRRYKNRFLVKHGEQLLPIPEDQIAYFHASNELVCMVRHDGKKFLADYTLEQLENLLNPELFFRLNRQCIARLTSIQRVHPYFNGKLKIDIAPVSKEEILVSREKSASFKTWLEG